MALVPATWQIDYLTWQGENGYIGHTLSLFKVYNALWLTRILYFNAVSQEILSEIAQLHLSTHMWNVFLLKRKK